MHPLAIKARKEQLQTLQVSYLRASPLDFCAFISTYSNTTVFSLFWCPQCLVEVEDYVKLRQKCSLRSRAVPTEKEVEKLISVWEVCACAGNRYASSALRLLINPLFVGRELRAHLKHSFCLFSIMLISLV